MTSSQPRAVIRRSGAIVARFHRLVSRYGYFPNLSNASETRCPKVSLGVGLPLRSFAMSQTVLIRCSPSLVYSTVSPRPGE